MKNDWISDIRMGGSIPNGESLPKSEYIAFTVFDFMIENNSSQRISWSLAMSQNLAVPKKNIRRRSVDHIWYWYVQVLGKFKKCWFLRSKLTWKNLSCYEPSHRSSGCFVAKVTGNGQPDTDHEVSGHAEADATPRKINMKPEDTPLEEENHRLKPSFSGFSC